MKWYKTLENKLMPTDFYVKSFLILIIIISLFMLFQNSKSLRTLWTIYLISP